MLYVLDTKLLRNLIEPAKPKDKTFDQLVKTSANDYCQASTQVLGGTLQDTRQQMETLNCDLQRKQEADLEEEKAHAVIVNNYDCWTMSVGGV